MLRKRDNKLAMTSLGDGKRDCFARQKSEARNDQEKGEKNAARNDRGKGEMTSSQAKKRTTRRARRDPLCVTASEAKQSQNQRIRDCFARRKNEFAMTSPLVVARAESPKQPRSSGVLLRLLRKRDYELAVTPFPSSRASLSQSFRVFLLWSFRALFLWLSEPLSSSHSEPRSGEESLRLLRQAKERGSQ